MLSTKRIIAIVFIFLAATIAWSILGGVASSRTNEQQSKINGVVENLWGAAQTQVAPGFNFEWETQHEQNRTEVQDGKQKLVREWVTNTHNEQRMPEESRINADISLDQRLKGLLWYSLYDVGFSGDWRYIHQDDRSGWLIVSFDLPDHSAIYDDFNFVVNGVELAATVSGDESRITRRIPIKRGDEIVVHAHYKSRGQDTWVYRPQHDNGVVSLKNFSLDIHTNFADIDFPASGTSPSSKTRVGDGYNLSWSFVQVVTGHSIGVTVPQRLQPGELAAALAHSAPVSLLFFFLVLVALSVLRGIEIHPVNYLFIAGAFFAFHLLFTYSVDRLPLGVAFGLASAVSMFLVASYLRLVVSPRFAFGVSGAAQLVYQVGFSLAHFWDGYTGLTITVLSILTLFLLMQLTGRLRWATVLSAPTAAAAGTGR